MSNTYKEHVLLSGQEKLTADYKTRNPNYNTHKGMDFVDSANNMRVVAIADGEVVSCRYDLYSVDHNYNTAGNYVRIKHKNGYYTRYLHLFPQEFVEKGDKVKKGQVIGIMGNTGDSYGTHLHFDVFNGSDYVDPLPFLNGEKSFNPNESTDIEKGQTVVLKHTPLYASSTTNTKSSTLTGEYYLHDSAIINNRVRITRPKGNSDVTGWVKLSDITILDYEDIELPDTDIKKLKVGDKVTVNKGSKTYDNKSLAAWVYTSVFDVLQVGKLNAPDYIVIGIDGAVTAAVHRDNLSMYIDKRSDNNGV